MHRLTLVLAFAVFFSACIHATPVSPAPLATDEAAQLQEALIGTCDVTERQKEGGSRQKAEGLAFTFGRGGAAGYVALGFPANYHYQLDGKNILMDGPYKAFRVDDWSGKVLTLFVYDLSETYFCTKR